MAYATGGATDSLDLFTEMKDFAVANGWTLDDFSTDGTGNNTRLHIHKGSLYFNFRLYVGVAGVNGGTAHTNAIFCNGSTGYSGASAWYDQANSPQYTDSVTQFGNSGMVKLDGAIPSYHFFSFTNVNYEGLYFVVENPAGVYQWIMCGTLDKTKYGTSTGGQFHTGLQIAKNTNYASPLNFFGPRPAFWTSLSPQGYLRVDNGSGLDWAWSDPLITTATLAAPRTFDSIRQQASMWFNTPNSFNGLPLVMPITLSVFVDGNNFATTTPWSPIGEMPYMYWCNIKTLNPGETFTIASDQYKAFPFFKKSDLTYNSIDPFTYGSSYLGFASRIDI